MNPRKRTREGGSSGDIRTLFLQERERMALHSGGPFFLERRLFPRFLNRHCRLDGLSLDPTRMYSDVSGGGRCFASLALPERVEADAQRQHYRRLRSNQLQAVVSPAPEEGLRNYVSDIVFDMQEQFALISQKRRLTLYTTDEWPTSLSERETSVCSSPLVKIRACWRSYGSYGFSAVHFLSSSLNVVAGYYQAPYIDIFDLEVVDEETSAPQQRFNLEEIASGGSGSNSNDQTEYVFANDVVAITEQVSLAALSSGLSVWLDRRSGKIETCSGLFAREYNIGSPSVHTTGKDPLTAIAFLYRDDPVNVVCGTQKGAVQLWDVRCVRNYVAVHQTSSSISRLHPSYDSPLCGTVWLNNKAGDLQGLSVGPDEMRLFADTKYSDSERFLRTCFLPSPRLSVIDSTGLIVCPHLSTNALLFFELSSLLRNSSPPRCARAFICADDDDDDNSDEDDDSSDEDDEGSFEQSTNPFSGTGARMKWGEKRGVHNITFSSALEFEGTPNISACSVWGKCNRVCIGDTEGRVQLA